MQKKPLNFLKVIKEMCGFFLFFLHENHFLNNGLHFLCNTSGQIPTKEIEQNAH